jgi:hypothetical protein
MINNKKKTKKGKEMRTKKEKLLLPQRISVQRQG